MTVNSFCFQTSAAIGRRLSKDTTAWLTSSPPDMNTRRRSHLDIAHTKSLTIDDAPSSDKTKYLTLSHVNLPVISQAATMRLAGSDIKVRPRMPSPPRSPAAMRNLPTPKINISDTSLYETVVPDKPRATHSRSKSLDNKPMNLTLVEIPTTPSTATTTSTAKNNEKQTVNYATLEHKVNLKTIKNNTKSNENSNVEKCSYAEMTQTQKQTVLKQVKNEDKPQVAPKSNALKQIQARAYSAPESYRTQAPTVIYIPEETFKSDYKKCFETFPKEKRAQDGHRSRYDTARCGSMGRSSSVPEQRYVVTAADAQKRRKEAPVVTIQHTSDSHHPIITRTFTNPQANKPVARTITQTTPSNVQATPTRQPTPSTQTRVLTHALSTPSRSTQYYSSQSFDTPKRSSLAQCHAYSLDTPRNAKTCYDGKSNKTHATPLRTTSQHQASCDDSARNAPFHYNADIIRSVHHHPYQTEVLPRSHHLSFDSSTKQTVVAPARSTSLQSKSPSKCTPKRNPGILQHASKSIETPPRSSSLHQNVIPPARTSSLQHAASAEATPTRTPGILKTRRRSRSRDLEVDLPIGPGSPRDTCDAQNREILLTIKRQTHGYIKPP